MAHVAVAQIRRHNRTPIGAPFRISSPQILTVLSSLKDSALREDHAKAKREEWKAKGNPPCEHRTLKLLYTVENYITGDYVCIECGALIGKVSKP